jgi:hypothetical protein
MVSSAAAAASAAPGNKQEIASQKHHQGHKGGFSLKGIVKGIEKIGADILGDLDHKGKDDVPFDEMAWCDEHFTRGCGCKLQRNAANKTHTDENQSSGEGVETTSSSQQQQQQAPSNNTALHDSDKPAKPCFQRPINPSSNLIANGWIEQQRRSKMRVVWKDVLASLVEGRRPGEETTLWIQRQVINQQTGKVTGLEALHQIPMKWLEDVNYVDLYGDQRFTLKVCNIAEEFYFRTRDEQSAQSWVLTLRSARDASLEGINRMNAGAAGVSGNGSIGTEKINNLTSTKKDINTGPSDVDDWNEGGLGNNASASGSSPPMAQAGSDGGGADSRPSSSGSIPQHQQQASVRLPIAELRAIAHGAGYNTRGMERQDLERIAAHVKGGPHQQTAQATTAGADVNHSRQQEAAMREAEQRAAAEKREKAQEAARRQQKENEERAAVENMRREREAAEKKRIDEQMAAAKAAAEQRRRQQAEVEQQAAEIKRKQEEERQRKMEEIAAAERARQQAQQEQFRRQQQQQQKAQIPTPPTSGGYPQGGNFQQQHQNWGQPQQQQHYQQWQQHHQHQQQPHFQQQGNQNFYHHNQNGMPHFQQRPQQQRPQHQPQPNTQSSSVPNQPQQQAGAPLPSKYAKDDEGEEQSTATLQIKRSILINWALQPPNLNVLRPIDQLITTIHTAMPPAYGVAAHAYFAKFTPIPRHELVVSAAMGNHPDETKLKKAVRKVRVFLHPDKLPKDLTSDQQFMARMLWDITSDSWEEFQKHKDELDWIRS